MKKPAWLKIGPDFTTHSENASVRGIERYSEPIRYGIALLLALISACILFAAQGEEPLNALAVMFRGGLAKPSNIGSSLRWATPCMLAGAAVIMTFRSGFRNMGIEGQVYMGAMVSAIVGCRFSLPHLPHVLLCVLAGGIAGMLYALIPAFLRLFFGIHELVVTIMLNFVARLFTYYYVFWIILGGKTSANGAQSVATPKIQKSAELMTLIKGATASTGFIIAILILIGVSFIYRRTIFGYECTQIGQNMEYARVGGVNVVKRFFQVFIISGFLAGACGALEVCGSYHRFIADFSANMGWEAIMVTNVSGCKPIILIFFACVWGVLKAGSLQLERSTSLSRYSVNIIQFLFILFVSVDYVRIFLMLKEKRRAGEKNRILTDGGGKEAQV